MLFALSFAAAYAATPAAPCAAPTNPDALLADLSTAQDLVRASDPAAHDAGTRLASDVACLGEPLPAMMVGPTYRAIGAAAIVGGDEATARRWFRAALSADPTGSLGTEDAPADSPAFALFEAIRGEGQPSVVTDAAHKLAAGTWTLDGKALSAVAARDGMPHLLQHKDASGAVQSWLIDGATFPAEALAKADVVAEAGTDCPKYRPNKRYAPPGSKFDLNGDCKADVLPPRPMEKTPLQIAGLALLAGAGGMYGVATSAHAQFEAATLLSDVERYKALTNQMVTLSGVTAAVGVASLGWGVIVSDEGTVIPRISGRF